MSDEKPHEILIIRRGRSHDEDGHHGAWKIAFADFMTAMMALFLVLWLVGSTNQRTKASLARYFNPVKLIDMTIQKRGLHDPVDRNTEDADWAPKTGGGDSKSKSDTKDAAEDPSKPNGASIQKSGIIGAYQATHSEATLFRDPYGVLAEIAAAGPGTEQRDKVDNPNVGAAANFQDPFQAGAPEVPQRPTPSPSSASSDTSDEISADKAIPLPTARSSSPASNSPSATPQQPPKAQPAQAAVAQSAERALDQPPQGSGAAAATNVPSAAKDSVSPASGGSAQIAKAEAAAKDAQPGAAASAEAQRLQQEIAEAIGKSAVAPDIKVRPTPEGILISLTDGFNYAMFAIGSAEPQARTIQVMSKVAQILKKEPGKIVITGHTDGRAYKSRNYDNWRLSEARAQMALYMLVRAGLDEKRIESVEGRADHDLKVPKDPYAAENRRIEILLRGDKP